MGVVEIHQVQLITLWFATDAIKYYAKPMKFEYGSVKPVHVHDMCTFCKRFFLRFVAAMI